jgi:ATP-dependent protease ClpP protease subunit
LIVPHPYYRLNPKRALHIVGQINRDLLSRLTPQIFRLQNDNRDPITAYIDSGGGNVLMMEMLLRTLRLTDQDSSDPCHIITAVTTRAASAAADLLSSGDYAVAFPHSTILYHGMRTQESDPLTVESTSALTRILRRSNDRYALELMRKIDERFKFRFLFARSSFGDVRAKHPGRQLTDLECFIKFIDEKLSSSGREVWQRTQQRSERYNELFTTVLKKVKGPGPNVSPAKSDAEALKAIIDYELKANRNNPQWTFKGGGIERLNDDFFLFHEYLSGFSDRLQSWSVDLGKLVLAPEVTAEIDAIQDEKERERRLFAVVAPLLEPLASFFAAFCHALQEGENELTATDAYWLGLVDEVIGQDDLLCLRHLEENRPDPVPPQPQLPPHEEIEAQAEEEVAPAAGA